MHALLKTTTASAALAAALSISPLAALAQNAASEPTTAAPDTAATGEATMAQDGAAAQGETAEAPAADIAQGEAADAPAPDAQATDAQATDAPATDMAQDDASTGPADGAATDMTADGAAAPDADAAQTAQAEAGATGDMEMTASVTADAGQVANPPEQPNGDMQAVLDKLTELGAQPLGTLSVEETRAQPTPADAAMAVMEERGIEMPAELAAIATREVTYPAGDGSEQPIRIYTPEGEGPFPLVVYFHGGGWVIADLDTYDASARALAAGANAVVASVEYRHAPENRFPAAHEDADAAYAWIVENSGSLNADSERLAVAGESAGGNLALNVAINARDAQLTQPDGLVLVYPVAGNDMETPSYNAYADAQPLSKQAMMWFVENVFEDPSQTSDPRLNLVGRDDLAGLPPTTIINAEIDPLQSEGEMLAERMAAQGVEVQQMTYPGVAHEFFGMGAVVPEAKQAEDMATAALRTAFGEAGAATADAATTGEVTNVEPTAADSAAPADVAAPDDGAAMEMDPAAPATDDAATGQ
ncbi:alpha/beta hydrolase [Rubellimicrobium arenae]|uniref:alpha/beta hydrolase n=1 Tax=Rubellimicrobium arenae TaxID=2817372 RepID=UPI001FED9B7B|nr:alpha/beta hydrolase [Rubellimicrobium arenae]